MKSGGFFEGFFLGWIFWNLVSFPFKSKGTFLFSLGVAAVIFGGIKASESDFEIAIPRPIWNIANGKAWDYEPEPAPFPTPYD